MNKELWYKDMTKGLEKNIGVRTPILAKYLYKKTDVMNIWCLNEGLHEWKIWLHDTVWISIHIYEVHSKIDINFNGLCTPARQGMLAGVNKMNDMSIWVTYDAACWADTDMKLTAQMGSICIL